MQFRRPCGQSDKGSMSSVAVHIPPIPGRLIQTFMYVRTSPDDNHYAHPLDFTPIVDLNLEKVSQLTSTALK